MILTVVRDILRASAAVRDRVDQGVNYPGIYADHGPQSVRGEYIVLQNVTGDNHYALTGEIGTQTSIIQVDCYSDRSEHAQSLFALVRNLLSGYSNTDIAEATIIGGLGSAPAAPADSSHKWTYRFSKDFQIFHYESVPTLT